MKLVLNSVSSLSQACSWATYMGNTQALDTGEKNGMRLLSVHSTPIPTLCKAIIGIFASFLL